MNQGVIGFLILLAAFVAFLFGCFLTWDVTASRCLYGGLSLLTLGLLVDASPWPIGPRA